MASIRREVHIDARPETVWDALRDVGALHHRLVPGFVTGAVGLLLLVPFVRRPLRSYALRRLQARVRVATVATGGVGSRFAAYDITDVRSYERSEPDRRTVTPLELGPGPEGRAT